MILNAEVNHTLATLHKIEFVFWVIVKNLIYKSPLLSLYIIVHEIFTSYSSSFNSFKFIKPFSSVEKLFPSSALSQKVIRSKLFTPYSSRARNIFFKFEFVHLKSKLLFIYLLLLLFLLLFSFFIHFHHSL